jgi:predicted transporter
MKDLFKKAAVIGYIARGIVLIIIGYFLFHAALISNPEEAQGTGAAFDFLENKFGSLMMGIVALGLVGYGVFTLVKAKYQKIDLDF